jgi:hypothetical protein
MKKIMTLILVSMFSFIGCATNPIVNGKNVGGLIGASGGAYGGSILCKNCKGVAKVASIGGGALIGWLAGSYAGSMLDEADLRRREKLIQNVLENNKDNEVSTTSYEKSWKNPNTGREETAVVSQSAVPLRTYQQPQHDPYAHNDIQPLRNRNNQIGTYNRNRNNQIGTSLYASNHNEICRDMEITISIDVEGGPPSQRQFYRACRMEQGWKMVD